jgi:homoserine kinase type II
MLCDGALLDVVASEFALGPQVRLAPLKAGIGRAEHLLVTRKGRFLLRVDPTAAAPELQQELQLLDFFREHGLPCPRPVLTRKSAFSFMQGDSVFTLRTYIDGTDVDPDSVRLEQMDSLGRVLGEIHAVGKLYKRMNDHRLSLAKVSMLYQVVRKKLPPHLRAVVRVLDDECDYLDHSLDGGLAKGLIHGNPGRQNVRFKGGRVVGIMGFSGACRAKMIDDLATAINAFCFVGDSYHLGRFESLIHGYETVRPLSLPEWDCFPNELRFSALKHAVRRLTDLYLSRSEDLPQAHREFREFFQMLLILRREREGGIEDLLMAMATGYDYRKYQKVRGKRTGGKPPSMRA